MKILPLPETPINADKFFSGGGLSPLLREDPSGEKLSTGTKVPMVDRSLDLSYPLEIPLSRNWPDKILSIQPLQSSPGHIGCPQPRKSKFIPLTEVFLPAPA